jgi:hypothetical protein
LCAILLANIVRTINIYYFDNDFFHIANTGREILKNGFFHTNVFFIEDGYEMVVQQWLYAVMLYKSYDIGGYFGVWLFTVIQVAFLGYLSYRYLRFRSIDKILAVVLSILSLYLVPLNCRPEAISLILLLLQLICTEYYLKSRKEYVLYFLPLLTLIENNIHSSYVIFHFVFIIPYLFSASMVPGIKKVMENAGLKLNTATKDFFTFPVILMLGAALASPYGIKAVMVPFLSGNIGLIGITEMQPLTIKDDVVMFLLAIVCISIAACRKRKLRESTLYFVLGLIFLTLMALKNEMFLYIALILSAADLFEAVNLTKLFEILRLNKKMSFIALLIAVVGTSYFLLDGFVTVKENGNGGYLTYNTICYKENDCEMTPVNAVRYIQDNEEDPKSVSVMTAFNNGSYFLWNGIGKVYIEPKTEPYLKTLNGKFDVISEYYALKFADSDFYKNFLKKYDFDYICVSHNMNALLVYLEQTDSYEKVVESSNIDKSFEKELGYVFTDYQLYKKRKEL